VTTAELKDAGHMAPLTHPYIVNAAIQEHIGRIRSPLGHC
jgi:hypothetical protein